MGGGISKEQTFTFEDIIKIPKESILDHWIKGDEEVIILIEAFINAKHYGVASAYFPHPHDCELVGIKFTHDDLTDLYKYKELLKKKIDHYCLIFKKEQETFEYENMFSEFMK